MRGGRTMNHREDVARAVAFFEQTDDIELLHRLLGDIATKAKRMVGQFVAAGTEDSIPPPADIRAAREPATRDQALTTLKTITDFALLQVLARSIGQHIEAAEIAASAEFPDGVRVAVPVTATYPPTRQTVEGIVEQTGTMLSVRLDNGETWHGPPTLARLVAPK